MILEEKKKKRIDTLTNWKANSRSNCLVCGKYEKWFLTTECGTNNNFNFQEVFVDSGNSLETAHICSRQQVGSILLRLLFELLENRKFRLNRMTYTFYNYSFVQFLKFVVPPPYFKLLQRSFQKSERGANFQKFSSFYKKSTDLFEPNFQFSSDWRGDANVIKFCTQC